MSDPEVVDIEDLRKKADQASSASVPDATRGRLSLKQFVGGTVDYKSLAKTPYGLRPLAVLFLVGTLSSIATVGAPYLALMIKHDLGLNFFKLAAIGSAVGAAAVLMAGPIGYLADRSRRTLLVGFGGLFHTAGLLLQGLAYTPVTQGIAGAFTNVSTHLTTIPQATLLADYYPVDQRVKALTISGSAAQLTAFVLPYPMIWVVSNFGWRVPFWFAWIPMLAISLYVIFRLPEPARGYQERKAQGASEEDARHEQPKPSWAESWRLVWSVRTLRFGNIAAMVTGLAGMFGIYSQAYFFERWHLSPVQLTVIAQAQGLVGLPVMLLGGGALNVLAARRPQRVLKVMAGFSLAASLGQILIVEVPFLPLSIALHLITGSLGYLLLFGVAGLMMNVSPPRARGVAASIQAYVSLPTILLAPIAAAIADNLGVKTAVLIGALFPLLAAVIKLVGAKYYEYDVRNAKLSAVATEEYQRAKKAGRTKQLVSREVDVHYGAVQILFGVNFDVEEGELIALLGTNGAGKSTLLRAISGLTEASSGAVVFDGDDITHIPPNEIAAKGIIYMQGGRSGFPSLTVRENLVMGSWLHGDKPDHPEHLERVFTYFPILRERLDQVAGTLSGGEQQMLALSQAFLARPKMLLIDELSLGLAPAIVDQLLAIVRAIHENGTTIVVVEQSVNIALKVAKRAIFMEKGEVRFTGATEELLNRPDILRSVFLKGATAAGREQTIGSVGGFATSVLPSAGRAKHGIEVAPNILEVSHLSKSFGGRPALSDVSFNLREGEILGIIGANGAGKTTLFDVLSGFQPQESGRILFAGEDITFATPDARARLGLIRRFQDARLFPTLTVGEVIAISFERQLEVRSMFLHGLSLPVARRAEKRLRAKVDNLVELMQLDGFRDKFVSDLSTGTRRIVDLACVIATGPKVLLLDEPSAGIAQKESEEMGPLLQRVRFQTGCSMLVIEHDMALISQLADELIVLHLGAVMTRGEPKLVLEDERVVSAYLGRGDEAVAAKPVGV